VASLARFRIQPERFGLLTPNFLSQANPDAIGIIAYGRLSGATPRPSQTRRYNSHASRCPRAWCGTDFIVNRPRETRTVLTTMRIVRQLDRVTYYCGGKHRSVHSRQLLSLRAIGITQRLLSGIRPCEAFRGPNYKNRAAKPLHLAWRRCSEEDGRHRLVFAGAGYFQSQRGCTVPGAVNTGFRGATCQNLGVNRCLDHEARLLLAKFGARAQKCVLDSAGTLLGSARQLEGRKDVSLPRVDLRTAPLCHWGQLRLNVAIAACKRSGIRKISGVGALWSNYLKPFIESRQLRGLADVMPHVRWVGRGTRSSDGGRC